MKAVYESNGPGRKHRGILLPEMAPFAGLIFLLVCFYLLTNQFRQHVASNVRIESLPFSTTRACFPENNEAIVSLTRENQLAFAVDSREAQTLAIQKVAQQHKISFTVNQLNRLADLPYLATNIENLPRLLSLASDPNHFSHQSQAFPPLSEQQLVECVSSAKSAVQTLYHKPIYLSLRIDAEVTTGHVSRLLERLETSGFHHLRLHTQYK
ncbi:biopolymer transporter ExbD [Hymenobacter segetis]|uniref:Biopolymer transporter ExbD n=1 Tax=Hymenobacter segetis TaxID=2025509 RepID=A0ABU9LU41_9BACT